MGSWGKVDFDDFKKLKKRLDDLEKGNAAKFHEDAVRELAARMLSRVIKLTPTGRYPAGSGKSGGTLKRGWTAKTESEAVADPGPGNQRAYMAQVKVRKKGNFYEIELINPVHYASYVEYGHRTASHKGWVSGRHMMRIAEKEVEAVTPKVLEKKLEAFLREVFRDDK